MGRPAIDRTRCATYQDVLDAPEHLIAQVVDGELILSPRPAIPHASSTSGIGADLHFAFHRRSGGGRGPGGWWILDEPELHLDRDILVPDLAGWRRERLPELPRAPYLTMAPDWVCEVLSPATARLDRIRKTRIYSREAVGHLWLVDPDLRTLEVLQLEDGRWVLLQAFAGDEPV
ncbi:MAG: Uma2 family endonuclease, partial [Deltaproteobacteria bacterium]|nr:Uma2 family endonuclease [Deltaproteobacteria bacterium]